MINPLIPMLAITGKPDENQITHTVAGYAGCGFDQLMLYPRDGCELSYLTDEWFDTIEAFIKAGKKHNIRFWLYDEFNYPSGGCKGRVMAQDPDFCLKYVKAELINGKYEPKLLKNEKYPDILNPDAMDYFIASTHEKYKEKFEKYFGNDIAGIFTDEPSFYYGVWEEDELPFYPEMPDEYFALTGKKFYDDYNTYYQTRNTDFLKDCYKLLSDRMYMSFTKRVGDWCKKNNLYMTGHLMNDGLPVNSVRSNGNLLKQLSAFSLPAVDDIFSVGTSTGLLASFSAVQYASRHKDGAGAELFALGPCDISFSKMRMMLWYGALFGVNHYFLAIAHLDVRGNAYRKFYFNDYSPDNPCSFAYKAFGEEAKKAAEFAKKEYIPEVYVRFPFEIASYELFGDKKTDRRFGELLEWLRRNQIQYMLVNDENVSDRPVIEITKNGFWSDGVEYTDVSELSDILKKEKQYTLSDGTLSDNIMVRSYADGTDVILNLTDREISLIAADGSSMTLASYGVKIATETEKEYKCLLQKEVKDVCFEDDNIVAATFNEDSVYEFEIVGTVELTIAKRIYPGEVNITLDDKIIDACDDSVLLPYGFNRLYKQTKKTVLTSGKHKLACSDGIKVFYKYLPEIMLVGDIFSYGRKISASKDISNISRFGRWTFGFDMELSAEKQLAIAVEGTDKPLELYADGKSLGTCAVHPYIWNIPKEYLGDKVRFELRSASDLSNIFGDTYALEKLDGTPGWCRGYTPEFQRKMPDIKVSMLEIIL